MRTSRFYSRVRVWFCLWLIGAALASGPLAVAQHSVLVSPQEARIFGLRRSWFTQIEMDRSRARVVGMHQHVSSTRKHTIFEVQNENAKYRYSERDVDRFGRMIGLALAEKRANDKIAALETTGASPKLVKLEIPQITLYVTTDRANLHAIDGEDGKTRWAETFGNPNYPSEIAAATDDVVAFVNGRTLFLLNQDDGAIRWQRGVVGTPVAGPAVSDLFVYVPTAGGGIEFYDLEETRTKPAVYRSNGRVYMPPTITANNVTWHSDTGELYVCGLSRTFPRFRIELGKAIVAAPTPLPGNLLLVATVDGYLNCIHEFSQSVMWRFSTGESVTTSPIVVGQHVFLLTDRGTLFCLTSTGGEELWQISGVTRFLAASQDRLYCTNRSGHIQILRAKTGARIGSMPAMTADLNFVNTQTDRIFFGSKTGVLQCLREEGQEFPLLHIALREPEDESTAPRPRAPGPRPMETPAEDVDPFGGNATKPAAAAPADASEDPFGAPAAPAPPAPKPPSNTPGKDEDPFG